MRSKQGENGERTEREEEEGTTQSEQQEMLCYAWAGTGPKGPQPMENPHEILGKE